MANVDPWPQQKNRPTVGAVARWCLEHLGAHAAALVGVSPGASTADFHIVPLCAADPIDDIASLAIPPSWIIVVVVVDGVLIGAPDRSRLAVGVDRTRAAGSGPRRFTAEGAK